MVMGQFFNLQEEDINNDLEIIIYKIVKAYNINNKTHKIVKKNVIISRIRYF